MFLKLCNLNEFIILTAVFSVLSNLYFFNNFATVSLISNNANRIPTQLRGP